MTSPVPDALRTELAEVLATFAGDHGLGTSQWEHDQLAVALLPAIAPFLARARAEGAAEALREVAFELAWPDPRGMWRAADVLRARAAALSAPTTTEGDPT